MKSVGLFSAQSVRLDINLKIGVFEIASDQEISDILSKELVLLNLS